MKVALIQSTVKEHKEANLTHIHHLMDLLPEDVDVVVLPEMFITPYEHEYFRNNAITKGDESYQYLSRLAKVFGVILVAGSVPELDNDKLYNTTFVFDQFGDLMGSYRKMHLFSITYPNGKHFDEGDRITAGDTPVIVDTPFGKIGLMICFDIRFPALAKYYQQHGVNCIIVPAAFNTFTGPRHWDVTFRARAIDNQLFMLGCSPAADSFGNYEIHGHSLMVNPMGVITHQSGEVEDILIAQLDLNEVEQARQLLPIVSNQRDIH
jgi:predicted amidohydrolase